MGLVPPQQIDDAVANGRFMFGRHNSRNVRCCLCGGQTIPKGVGRRVYIDGRGRGYACMNCQRTVAETVKDLILTQERKEGKL